MKISSSIVLVTGANRGLGLAFVASLLGRGAARVYAAARRKDSLAAALALDSQRVVPLELDVTSTQSVQHAASHATDVNLLINNAGVLASFDVLKADQEQLRADIEVNYFGPLRVARAFAPVLARPERGAAGIVNVLSVVSLASMPALGGYSASKAAAHSLTQSLRAQLQKRGVRVFAAYPGPIDTDMIRGFDLPKTSPAEVAKAILDGVEAGDPDIYPDPASRGFSRIWQSDPRALELEFGKQFAAGGSSAAG
jgi:NAD(P)-dependent dehydrogenase (short-subunit alcohol dehydrogenase family)